MKKVMFILALSFLFCQNYAISSDKEMELENLYDKIVDGLGNPADIEMYNSLLDSYQSENRKRVDYKDMFNFSLNTDIEYQSGYQSGMTFLGSSSCSELVTINYDCSKLPWDNKNVYKRISEYGEIYTRSCGVYDGCVNEGILVISNDYRTTPPNPPTFIYREDDRFSYEEKSVVKFRMRQVITEKIPRPTGEDFYPFGYVVLNDGNKTLMVIFGEMMDGAKLILIPVEAIVTGDDFVITKLIATEYNWSYWSEYKFTVDKGGEVGLFIDNSFIPMLSYPYDMIEFPAMTSGGVIAFGNGGRHYTSGWTDWDYFDYAVGENSVGGCVSENGWLKIDNIFLRKKIVVIGYENSEIFVSGEIKNIDGLGSNTQGHVFYLRLDREVRNIDGVSIREIRSEVRIGPIGIGKNPESLIVEGVSGWDLKDKNGEYVREGIYTDRMNISIVRVDKKGKEKVLAEIKSVTNSIIIYYLFTNRVIKDLSAGTFGIFFDYYEAGGKNSLEPVSYYLRECSTGSDPILDILYDYDSTISTRFRKVKSNDDYNICRCEERPHGWPPRICRCENGSGVDIIPSYSGIIMGIVRAKGSDRAGSCKVERCGGGKCIILKESLYFDGKEIFWVWDREDGIQSVIKEENQDSMMILSDVADGGSGYQMLYTYGLPAIDDNSGTGAGSYIKDDKARSRGILYVGLKPYIKGLKVLDIYRNDSWEDNDGDRLGMELERELLLCDNKNDTFEGFRCDSVYNPRDTDGDGIEDYVEVMGCDRQCGDGVKLYPGCYGAEYNDSVCGSGKRLAKNKEFPQYLPIWGANPRRMDVFFEVDISEDYKQKEFSWDKIYKIYKNNSSIVNPDGSRGINMHFDVANGIYNEKCSRNICGNWGGSNTEVDKEYCSYLCKARSDSAFFNPIREKIFRHILLCNGRGISSIYSDCLTSEGTLNILPHEIGHSLGLFHYGSSYYQAVNYSPTYTSLMNYAYESIFNGSLDNIHLSSGELFKFLNPTKICENETINNVDLSFLSKDPFYYKLSADKKRVDWNRDGVIEDSCDKPIKADITFTPGSCLQGEENLSSYYRANPDILSGYTSSIDPKVSIYKGDLYVFYSSDSLWIDSIKLKSMSRLSDCANRNFFGKCDIWTEGLPSFYSGAVFGSPTYAEIRMSNGEERLYAVYRDYEGYMKIKYFNGFEWRDDNRVKIRVDVVEYNSPYIINHINNLKIIYTDYSSRELKMVIFYPDDYWSMPVPIVDLYGNPIKTIVTPSLTKNKEGVLHMAIVDEIRVIRIYYYDEVSGRWISGFIMNNQTFIDPSEISIRVPYTFLPFSIIFKYDETIRNGSGRLYIFYNQDKFDITFTEWDMEYNSWVWIDKRCIPSKIDNYSGVSSIYYTNNLFSLDNAITVFRNQDGRVTFLPYADGIIDIDMTDVDDWEIIKRGTCLSLHRPYTGNYDCDYCEPSIFFEYDIGGCNDISPTPVEP